jgi:uncharacterized membrane protein YfbV (UPF0208 family)
MKGSFTGILGTYAVTGGETTRIDPQDMPITETGDGIVWQGDLSSAPENPQVNWAYYDTVQKKSFIWDGAAWRRIAQDGADGADGTQGEKGDTGVTGADGIGIVWKGASTTAPASPETNWAYYNTTDKKAYIYDGAAWQILAQDGAQGDTGAAGADGIGIVWQGESTTAPANPQTNWAYYNTTDKKAYIYDGAAWQILAQDGAKGDTGAAGADGIGIVWQGESATAPASPQTNWAYYNTTDKKSYIYDGAAWQILAQDGAKGIGIVWQGALAAAPENPELNWAYYNTTDGRSYIYSNDDWHILAGTNIDDGQDKRIEIRLSWVRGDPEWPGR